MTGKTEYQTVGKVLIMLKINTDVDSDKWTDNECNRWEVKTLLCVGDLHIVTLIHNQKKC